MTPQEAQKFIETSTLEELCDSVIWQEIMAETAHCGWTDRAREGLVKAVQGGVRWAIEQKKEKVES